MPNQKIIIANWKMKLGLADTVKLAGEIGEKLADLAKKCELAVCPNFISLLDVKKKLAGTDIKMGAQDVFWEGNGAYTGEISASMLLEAGCKYVIIGHSERRKFLMENYEMIHREIKAVLRSEELVPVVCIGENWDERKTDRRDFVLFDQLQQALSGVDIIGDQKIIVAYEPIWAIGSGTAIEPSEAEYAHKIVKLTIKDMFGQKTATDNFRVIYGGSLNSRNVKGFVGMDNLDGVLVGGASLDAEEFYKVAAAIVK